MSEYTIRKSDFLTDAELDELTSVFGAAFASDPALKAVVGTERFEELLSAVNRSQLVAGRLAGQIYIAEDTNGRIIGGVVWFGPGREMYDSEDQRKLALAPLVEQMPADVKKWQDSAMPAIDKFKKSAFGDAARTQWYLQRIGVSPEWQGKGVGTALIEEVRKTIQGMSIALQAVEPKNFAYYESLGFEDKGHLHIKALYGEFTMRAFMWGP